MIDFTDPVLRSSTKSKQEDVKVTNKFTLFLIGIVIICFLLWIVYILQTSQIDTKTNPNNAIKVDDRINSIKVEGRLEPIQKTE